MSEVIFGVRVQINDYIIFDTIINHLFDYTNLKEIKFSYVEGKDIYTTTIFIRTNKNN